MIDNQTLIEEGHDYRLKEVTYNEEFVIVPKFVFRSLSRWYQCNMVIERIVLKEKVDKKANQRKLKEDSEKKKKDNKVQI